MRLSLVDLPAHDIPPSPPRLTSGATMIIAELPCFYFWPRYAALMLLQLRERLEWYLVCR